MKTCAIVVGEVSKGTRGAENHRTWTCIIKFMSASIYDPYDIHYYYYEVNRFVSTLRAFARCVLGRKPVHDRQLRNHDCPASWDFMRSAYCLISRFQGRYCLATEVTTRTYLYL